VEAVGAGTPLLFDATSDLDEDYPIDRLFFRALSVARRDAELLE